MRHLPVIWFLTVRGNLFSFIARIPTVLRDRQYIPRLCLWAMQTTIISTYSCERLNFPALAKIRSYSMTFVRERLQLLRWFFTWTSHLFNGKKIVFTARRSTSNICFSGKGTLRRCMCRFSCLPVAYTTI